MKICFMGTSKFALNILTTILNDNYQVSCIYTKPPLYKKNKPIDKNQEVFLFANSHNISLKTPISLKKDSKLQHEIIQEQYDIIIVVSYGLFLPSLILNAAKFGCFNIHASLLPLLRGASPIHYAILHNYTTTGISIIKMNNKMDEGDVILQKDYIIKKNIYFDTLYNDLSLLGGQSILELLHKLKNKQPLKAITQDHEKATYSKILTKQDGFMDFAKHDAEYLARKVRAFYIFPHSYFYYNKELIKIFQANEIICENKYNPGDIITQNNELYIACTKNLLKIEKLQAENRKILTTKDFLNGYKILLKNLYN